MCLTDNSDQVFLPGGCNRTQNLRFGPYTNKSNITGFSLSIDIKINLKSHFHIENYSGHIEEILVSHTLTNIPALL